MRSTAIHLQVGPDHWGYVGAFLNSLSFFLRSSDEIQIFVFSDRDGGGGLNVESINLRRDVVVRYISMRKVFEEIEEWTCGESLRRAQRRPSIIGEWGAGGHRSWVARKRSYSLLYLSKLGYSHAWCLDSESLFLKSLDFDEMCATHEPTSVLTIDENFLDPLHWSFPEAVDNELERIYQPVSADRRSKRDDNLVVSQLRRAGYRQNDFWFVNLSAFSELMTAMQQAANGSLSRVIGGSEQSLYERFLYSKHLHQAHRGIELLSLKTELHENFGLEVSDLHGNRLFNEVVQSQISISDFAEYMNDSYFQKIPGYRGDFLRILLQSERGFELAQLLNLRVALSNFQGL